MDKIQGIYKITNLINGKCYIGKSEDIEFRKKVHFRELNEVIIILLIYKKIFINMEKIIFLLKL